MLELESVSNDPMAMTLVAILNRKDRFKFYDGITWMMQLVMFMLLGLLAHPKRRPSAWRFRRRWAASA